MLAISAKWPGLKTRADDDFSIGLLDAWPALADTLTFYQERIANNPICAPRRGAARCRAWTP